MTLNWLKQAMAMACGGWTIDNGNVFFFVGLRDL